MEPVSYETIKRFINNMKSSRIESARFFFFSAAAHRFSCVNIRKRDNYIL